MPDAQIFLYRTIQSGILQWTEFPAFLQNIRKKPSGLNNQPLTEADIKMHIPMNFSFSVLPDFLLQAS